MYGERVLQEYTATNIQTGSPVRLVAMLYEGAVRFLNEAERAIDQRNYPLKAEKIHRAMKIVQELDNALDESADPELVQRLRGLYEYVDYEILQASTFNDVRHLRNATRVLERLHKSWKELAERNVGASTSAEAPGDDAQSSITNVSVPQAPPTAPTRWQTKSDEGHSERVPVLSISA